MASEMRRRGVIGLMGLLALAALPFRRGACAPKPPRHNGRGPAEPALTVAWGEGRRSLRARAERRRSAKRNMRHTVANRALANRGRPVHEHWTLNPKKIVGGVRRRAHPERYRRCA